MTREEAIQILKRTKDNSYCECDIGVALDMAIEALSEPSKVDYRTDKSANIGTEVNDLISRADAFDAIKEEIRFYEETTKEQQEEFDEGFICGMHRAKTRIRELPSADRPHGEWIKENIVLTSNPPQRQWHCSECGHLLRGYENLVLDNVCPNCGADMRGEST